MLVPYVWDHGDPTKNTRILDHLCAHPGWISVPTADEAERRVLYAQLLVDPDNQVWEVWRGAELVGILYLSQITGVDALLHFTFLDHNLIGKRRLLRRFLTQCFEDGFQRLSMQIPVFVPQLLHFARRALGFRFEGEIACQGHQLTPRLGIENPQVWIAKWGSRREQAHWHNGEWHDVHLLRLLKSEWEGAT